MSKCRNCSTELKPTDAACPQCGTSREGALPGLDRVVDQSLARMAANELVRSDSFDALVRDLDPDLGSPLSASELKNAIARVDDAPALSELESLVLGSTSLSLDGIQIAELFARGGEEETALKKGLVFLKKRRYDNAAEWWNLHLQNTGPAKPKTELLYLLMLAYTHQLADDQRALAVVRKRIQSHPIFQQLKNVLKR